MKFKRCIFLLLTLTTGLFCRSLSAQTADEFNLHYNKAISYSEISLYGPCIDELNIALDYAKEHHMEEQRIEAVITLAETMRRTGDFDKGLGLLTQLKGTSPYPLLHVRRLGRIAAIYDEWKPSPDVNQRDSVLHYLDSALTITKALHLVGEEAGLYNELGYILSGENRLLGLSYLLKSAALFDSLGDTHNYTGAMTNVLRCYLVLHDSVHARLVIEKLLPLIQGKKWYTAEIELYTNIASYYNIRGDSVRQKYWSSMTDKSIINNLTAVNSAQVNAFRAMYETKKLKEHVSEMELQARLKQAALDEQTRRTRDLVIFLSALIVLIMVVVALLIRERKLKSSLKTTNSELQVSNEKYHLLMVESNHRIKNNLQMVISMLQYSGDQFDEKNTEAFKRMSGKIHTISLLHKHLSLDVHNELVSLDVYFREIIALYENITPAIPAVSCSIAQLLIKSERIVYFGLILNEMIANTIAHKKVGSGGVEISVKATPHAYLFDYRDGSLHDTSVVHGTGSQLIRQLIQRVGGEEFRFEARDGHYQFQFYG